MENIDKRNRLDENPFSYRVSKSNIVFLDYFGKEVKIIKGKEAETFLKKISSAKDEKTAQLLMAKATGNFKRGNERDFKKQ
jgi:hypothetical protein